MISETIWEKCKHHERRPPDPDTPNQDFESAATFARPVSRRTTQLDTDLPTVRCQISKRMSCSCPSRYKANSGQSCRKGISESRLGKMDLELQTWQKDSQETQSFVWTSSLLCLKWTGKATSRSVWLYPLQSADTTILPQRTCLFCNEDFSPCLCCDPSRADSAFASWFDSCLVFR